MSNRRVRLCRRISTARIGPGPAGIAAVAFGDSIWSTDFEGGTVSVVSPSELRRVATGPAAGRLDPRTAALSRQVRLSDIFIGDANADVVAVGSGIWVSSPDEGAIYRIPIR